MKCACPSRFSPGFWLVIVLSGLGFGSLIAEEFTQKPQVAPAEVRGSAKTEESAEPEAPLKITGPNPEWIWGPNEDRGYTLSKEFESSAKSAVLIASCDNQMDIQLNGQSVAKSSRWESPAVVDVSAHLKTGKNVLTARVRNQGGIAGFVAKLMLTGADGKSEYILTDKTWRIAGRNAPEVKVLGKLGREPWGDVFSKPAAPTLPGGKRDVFQVLPGFQVELLYTVPKDTQGSWVCLSIDDKGRLLASDQADKGLFRITPGPIGSEEPTRVERLDVKMTAAQGLLHAFGSLYVSVNGGPGSGLYRLRDTNNDDQYDEVTKLKAFQGGGEHGPHALRLSPDGKSIYIVAGNHTKPPEDFNASRLPSNWDEDLLLPRQWDARGHARGILAPGGWVAKTDPEGKTWEMISSGYRNSYDMDFNADGELFVYDADMEWDMGMPWYRPTRVMHATSGSEFGWRSGTGKWPTYFPDSLPELADIGPGSPVGVTFGYGAKFPAKYQKALYLLDWTFGTIYAVHLEPDGASYKAEMEEFLSRTPLPLTDAVVGKDGALYFTVGGRGTQSELYRVTYTGKESTAPAEAKDSQFAELRSLRQQLEDLHNDKQLTDQQMQLIWTNLEHKDRFIRYAARVALEHQDPSYWRERLTDHASEADQAPWTVISASIALARSRQAEKTDYELVIHALGRLNSYFGTITKEQKLALLRAYALAFLRMEEPSPQLAAQLAKQWDAFYPTKDKDLNRELARLSVYVKSPTVIEKTLKLLAEKSEPQQSEISELLARNPGYGGTIAQMLANQPDLQKLHYAFVLRNMKYGWTLDERRAYLKFLEEERKKSGGASYQGFIDNMRQEFLENASEAERFALKSTIAETQPKPTELPKAIGPGKDWTLEEVTALTKAGLAGRDFENGKRAYAAARCVMCHRFGGEGGATGPDLTNVAGRFSFKDLSEAIIVPDKVISDQYRATKIQTAAGQIITGRVVSEADGVFTVVTDPEDATKVQEISKDDIEAMAPSTVSLMPKDLLKPLNKEEVLDLLAYLQSRGNPNDPMFAQKPETQTSKTP